MYGLGKHRSKYGRFLDDHDISQEEVRRVSRLNKDTVSKACVEDHPIMRDITKRSLAAAASTLSGKPVSESDFWF